MSVGLGLGGEESGRLVNWGKIVGRGSGGLRLNLRVSELKVRRSGVEGDGRNRLDGRGL